MNNPATDRLGISKLEEIFSSVGWLFREQFVKDYGIDAQVEIVENNRPTGQLIAIQIKTGESYCSEIKDNCIIYRPDARHIEYWVKHSLPVIIVIYNPKNDKVYWSPVNKQYMVKTRKSYKISIPQEQNLSIQNCLILKKVFRLNIQNYRINKLLLDLSWMKLINEGENVYVEFEDWVNKSLSRTSITIFCDTKEGHKELYIPQQYAPGYTTFGIIEKYIPWANVLMDVDGYREYKEEIYETNSLFETFYTESFDDWYKEPNGIVPIRRESEIDFYRVKLELNEIGKAFLKISEYLFDDMQFELQSFSIEEI